MLQKVRDNAESWGVKSVLWMLVFAFVGTIFFVWGVGDNTATGAIATIDGDKISVNEYKRRLDKTSQQYGQISSEALRGLGIGQQVINSMIFEKLQLQEAKRAGIVVTRQELVDTIRVNPAFHVDGAFNHDRYVAVLKNNRLKTGDFEELIAADLVRTKLVQMISDTVQVTEEEVKGEYNRLNQTINIQYVPLNIDNLKKQIKVSDAEISEFYEKNKFKFMEAEGRQIEYLYSDPHQYIKSVKVPEDEVREYYQENQHLYTKEEKVRARHILIRVPNNASPDMVEKLEQVTEDILAKVKKGANFAKTAKEYSEGPSNTTGGDLGYFKRGAMVPSFEKPAFELKPGQVSGIVRTQFGFHIIKVEDHQQASQVSYAEARPKIRQMFAIQKSKRKAKTKLNAALKNDANKDVSWKKIAQVNGFKFTSKSIKPGASIEGNKGLTKLINRSFSMENGQKTFAVEVGDGYYAMRVKDIIKARTVPLAEIKTTLRDGILNEKAEERAKSTAIEFLAKLKAGAKIHAEANRRGMPIIITGSFSRATAPKDKIQSKEDFQKAIFPLKAGSFTMVASGRTYYIVKVVSKRDADLTNFKATKTAIKKELIARKRYQVVMDWQQNLWRTADTAGKISIRADLL